MSLPLLYSELGTYFNSLALNYVCWSQDIALINYAQKIFVNFLKVRLQQTPFSKCLSKKFILIVVPLIRIDQRKDKFTEGYTFLLINTSQRTIEWIVPYTFDLNDTYVKALRTALNQLQLYNYTFKVWQPQDLVKRYITNPFFLTMYYLQTRLQNYSYTSAQILNALSKITSENIQHYTYSLISFAYNVPNLPQKRGIIICHGKKHGFKNIPDWVPRDALWWTLDYNSATEPDFVGDYTNYEMLKELGLFSWDYVLLQNCPISYSLNKTQEAIRAARWLLKPSGQLLFPKALSSNFFISDLNVPGALPSDFLKLYNQGQLPLIDQTFEKIKEEEFYSQYIPFGSRDLIMIA